MESWRDKVDPLIREHLEALIAESSNHREAYKLAKNTATAQVWCATAILQKQIVDLSLRIKFLEKVLKEMGNGKGKDAKIDAEKELRNVLKKL